MTKRIAESIDSHLGNSIRLPDALKHFDALPDAAFVRQPVVEALYACSSATVWRRVRDGGIPRPRKFSPRVSAWNVGELRLALQGPPQVDAEGGG